MHKIWIADDDQAIRLILEESLGSAGFETKLFSTGEELVKELENIVYSGTKINIKYYINDILDDDRQEEIFDYFKSTEEDSINDAVKEFDGEYSLEELQLMRIQFISEMAN